MPLAAARALTATLVAAAAGLGVAAEPAEPPPLPPVLRLEDALRLLRERGIDLLIAETAIVAAEGDVGTAGAIPNPALSLSYGRSFTYGRCTDGLGGSASCGILTEPQAGAQISDQGATFDSLSGKRGLRLRGARSAAAAARASRDDVRRTLEAQTKQAFVQTVIAKETLETARSIAAASARTAELIRARYEAGSISEADVARIDVAKLEADQAADTAAQALRDAKIALAFLLGVREQLPDFDVAGPEFLSARSPRILDGATVEGMLRRARNARPDLAAALRRRESAEAALALARRQRFPDISLTASYAQQGTTPSAISPPTVTAGVSLPIPVFYLRRGELERAEAELRTQSLQATKVEAQVVSDVEAAFSGYATASLLVRRMETSLLERARRARDLVSTQYQKGAASLIEFLDAQRTFIGTNAEYLQDLSQFWNAVFRLEQAVGEELR